MLKWSYNDFHSCGKLLTSTIEAFFHHTLALILGLFEFGHVSINCNKYKCFCLRFVGFCLGFGVRAVAIYCIKYLVQQSALLYKHYNHHWFLIIHRRCLCSTARKHRLTVNVNTIQMFSFIQWKIQSTDMIYIPYACRYTQHKRPVQIAQSNPNIEFNQSKCV